jgi:hypothetical protein
MARAISLTKLCLRSGERSASMPSGFILGEQNSVANLTMSG